MGILVVDRFGDRLSEKRRFAR
ncbi:uncharacterized protein G2W53_022054 [Senna tora]|uniref:Uncharacterized protein n=1 Tax=Senna tora TaxID=362788 RepID=A0A834WHS9_9FABA|nr:uncharacterized protein G2W53_022054 [Senna tora]